jgi:hypothetical protein
MPQLMSDLGRKQTVRFGWKADIPLTPQSLRGLAQSHPVATVTPPSNKTREVGGLRSTNQMKITAQIKIAMTLAAKIRSNRLVAGETVIRFV